MPRERVLTESDGPFAQVEQRTIFPWDVGRAVAVLAELWSVPFPLARETLFGNLKGELVSDGRQTSSTLP